MTTWFPTLKTATPQGGYELAVKMTQPDADVRDKLRPVYAGDADALIASSQVAATHFSTVTAANNYWREAT